MLTRIDIKTTNTNINRVINKKISFGSGKVDLYSDFDHTYFPGNQCDIKTMSPQTNPGLSQYFDKFKSFLNNTREGLKFHITSGRTFGEFETVSWQLKESGFKMPLPDTFIAKNGSDEYLRVASDEDFYSKGKFPFEYGNTNKEKENKLKNQTNWDGIKFKNKIKEILKEYNFKIIEHDSENSVKDYGYKSLFSHIHWDNFEITGKNMSPKSEWVVGLRNDGNLKIYMSYPYDMNFVPERAKIKREIHEKFGKFIEDNDAKVTTIYKDYDKSCGNRPVDIFTPQMDKSYRYAPDSKEENFTLTKLYDTKEAVKQAIKNNDLVIVAGDSSNDINMLNPSSYIDIPQDAEMGIEDPSLFIKRLKLNPIKDAKEMKRLKITPEIQANIVKQIKDLPFIGIVVKNESDGNKLKEIVNAFGQGKFPKIIEVEPGHLEDGVIQAIKTYAKKNPKYAKKLSVDLKKEVLGITGKHNDKMKFLGIGASVLSLVGGTAIYLNKQSSKTKPIPSNS